MKGCCQGAEENPGDLLSSQMQLGITANVVESLDWFLVKVNTNLGVKVKV